MNSTLQHFRCTLEGDKHVWGGREYYTINFYSVQLTSSPFPLVTLIEFGTLPHDAAAAAKTKIILYIVPPGWTGIRCSLSWRAWHVWYAFLLLCRTVLWFCRKLVRINFGKTSCVNNIFLRYDKLVPVCCNVLLCTQFSFDITVSTKLNISTDFLSLCNFTS